MSDLEDFKAAVMGVSEADPYARIHVATVVLQHDDGTLDLTVDGDAFPDGLTRIPYVAGVGGARLVIEPESVLRVAFAGGTPDGSFAFGLEPDPDADRGVVRVGDGGDGGTLSGATSAGPVTFTYNPPGGGAPQVGPTISLRFKADEGSVEVFIR